MSPLRRTILTAYNAFKYTANFRKIKFVLHPDLREYLGDADDVPTDIRTLIEEWASFFP